MAKKKETTEERIRTAVDTPDIPHLYFNGFANSMSSADVTLVLEKNAKPVGVLNMSYTMAKTLSVKLGVLVASLEAATGRPMLTTDEVESASKQRKILTKKTK